MIKNQTVLTTPMMFLSQLKALMKSFMQKKQMSKTPIAELFSKISNKKKISNNHCEANIFLEKVTKSLNSQINIESLGNYSVTPKVL